MASEAQWLRWKELAALLERAERRGLGALSVDEVQRLCRLYRHVTIDLSRARAEGSHPDEVRYLNGLAARAHGQVYHTRRAHPRSFFALLATGFPRLVRRHALPLLVATGVFLGSALASFVAVVHEPRLAYSLFDPNIVEIENLRLEKHQGEYRGNFTFDVAFSPYAAARIITNNVGIALGAFALGALLGLPCLIMLLYNGRMLGTLEGVTFLHGFFLDFNSLILTHGVLELSAICMAGGSGLMLAWAFIAPGNLPRREALRRIAPDALGILAGCCCILVLAGIIEAYITPHFSQTVRWSVAATTAVLLAAYILLPGRITNASPHARQLLSVA